MKKFTTKAIALTLAGTLLLAPVVHVVAATSATLLKSDSFTTTSKVYDSSSKKVVNKTFYHNNIYKDYKLFKGIDVSWWQGASDRKNTKVNWAKAHADGIDFAFIRIGSRERDKTGELYEDTTADSNITQAVANNVNVGVYFFSQALTVAEAKEEAKYALKIINKHNWKITLPVVFDYEFNGRLKSGMLKKATMTKICAAFCDTVKAAGYTPCIYANYSMFKTHLDTPTLAKSYKIWLARYSKTTTSNILSTSSAIPYADIPYMYEFWQYASTSRNNGYSGNLDGDYWYKNTNIQTTGLSVTAQTTDSIDLDWSPCSDAKSYKVYRFNPDTQSYQAIATTSSSNFTDTDLESGTPYQYKVRAYWTIGGTNYYGKYSDIVQTATYPTQVDGLSLSTRNSTNLTFSWERVKGATAYRIYQYNEDSDTYKRIDEVNNETFSYKVSGLSGATGYSFRVRAVKELDSEILLGASSEPLDVITRPGKVTNLKVRSTVKKQAKLTYTKVPRADHYNVYRYDSKTKKWTLIKSLKGTTSSYTDKNLVSKRTYQYRMRAYVTTDDGKIFGYYCDPVTIKVK